MGMAAGKEWYLRKLLLVFLKIASEEVPIKRKIVAFRSEGKGCAGEPL